MKKKKPDPKQLAQFVDRLEEVWSSSFRYTAEQQQHILFCREAIRRKRLFLGLEGRHYFGLLLWLLYTVSLTLASVLHRGSR